MKKWMIFSLLFCFSSEGFHWCAKSDLDEVIDNTVIDNTSSEFMRDYDESVNGAIDSCPLVRLVYQCKNDILELTNHSAELGWSCKKESLQGIIENQRYAVESYISNFELKLDQDGKNFKKFALSLPKEELNGKDIGELKGQVWSYFCKNTQPIIDELIKCVNNWISDIKNQCAERKLAVCAENGVVGSDSVVEGLSPQMRQVMEFVRRKLADHDKAISLLVRQNPYYQATWIFALNPDLMDYGCNDKIYYDFGNGWEYSGEGWTDGSRANISGNGMLILSSDRFYFQGRFVNGGLMLSEGTTAERLGVRIPLSLNVCNLAVDITKLMQFTHLKIIRGKDDLNFILTRASKEQEGSDHEVVILGNNAFIYGRANSQGSLHGFGTMIRAGNAPEIGWFEDGRYRLPITEDTSAMDLFMKQQQLLALK